MSTIQITCDNCGAKYKLPETFNSPKAKCQKCGSVIDVAGQRDAGDGAATAAKAASPSPAAAARPAVDRSKSKPPRAAAKTGGRASSRRGKSDDGGDDGGAAEAGGRRGRREPKPKDNKPLIFGGIGLIVLVIVVVVFLMQGGDDKPDNQQTAQTPPANQNDAANQQNAPTPAGGNAGTTDPAADTTGKPDTAKTTDPAADPAKPSADATPAEASAPAEKLPPDAPRWMRLKIQTMDQITDPKTYGEVPWDRIDASKKEQLQTWAADFAAGGRAGLDAENSLREVPYRAIFGVVDQLRGLDYKDPFDTMTGYALNRFLTDITGGLQAGFVAAELDETIDPRKAEWNGITVRTWLQIFDAYKTEAEFLASVKERKAAAAKEDK